MHSLVKNFLLVLGVLIAFPSPLLGGDVLTPEHVARIRSVTSAKISPDGKHIAYFLAVPRKPGVDDDGPAFIELHVASPEGESRPYVTGKTSLSGLDWAPDGQSISYLAKRNDDMHKSLYLIPLNGGESRSWLSLKTDIRGYSWSPDGRNVAFTAKEPESDELSKQKKQGFNQQVYEEDTPRTRVWISAVSPDADSPGEPRLLDLPGSASVVKWSPHGDQLAVALAPTPSTDDNLIRLVVHIVDVATGNITAKLDHAAKLGDFQWSPDSRHLATISGEDKYDPRDGRLLLWPAGGGSPRELVRNYDGHVSAIAWKNNDTLLFIGTEGVWTTLHEINLEGAEMKAQPRVGSPILHSLSLSSQGPSIAMVADTASHPREVFLLDGTEDNPRRLTQSNPWLSDISLARQEAITYQAQDGLEIGGVLIHPLEEKAGQRYPLILAVHGGPESCVTHGWITYYSMPGQMAAAQGMAVFYPNYRGSTGRGVEFSKMGQADAAGPEFRDLVDAIDHFVESGLVDRSKVGITGGSYGGYASAWGATYYSQHFAASVMFVGISDNVSKLGTTDIPDEMYLVHHRKRLWEDWDYFRERSPIRHVEKARTPLLILHGKEDPRVHPSQSLELHRHIKTLGQTPVRLILYPGEGHGNRRAASRYDYSLRLMRWMNHYLKGPGGDAPSFEMDYGMEAEEEDEGEEKDD